MTGDEWRDSLAAALTDPAFPILDLWARGYLDAEDIACTLLPVVRKIAADELRAAANEAHDEYSGWEAANVVRARAAALDPQ